MWRLLITCQSSTWAANGLICSPVRGGTPPRHGTQVFSASPAMVILLRKILAQNPRKHRDRFHRRTMLTVAPLAIPQGRSGNWDWRRRQRGKRFSIGLEHPHSAQPSGYGRYRRTGLRWIKNDG